MYLQKIIADYLLSDKGDHLFQILLLHETYKNEISNLYIEAYNFIKPVTYFELVKVIALFGLQRVITHINFNNIFANVWAFTIINKYFPSAYMVYSCYEIFIYQKQQVHLYVCLKLAEKLASDYYKDILNLDLRDFINQIIIM